MEIRFAVKSATNESIKLSNNILLTIDRNGLVCLTLLRWQRKVIFSFNKGNDNK